MDRSELEQKCERYDITARHLATPRRVTEEGWGEVWRSTVRLTRATMARTYTLDVTLRRGMAHARDDVSAADVLSSLLLDTVSGELPFGEFCEEMGYDETDRETRATWQACADMAPRVREFLAGGLFELLANAEH